MISLIEMYAMTIQHISLPIRSDTINEESDATLARCINSFVPKLHYAALNTIMKVWNNIALQNRLGRSEALTDKSLKRELTLF